MRQVTFTKYSDIVAKFNGQFTQVSGLIRIHVHCIEIDFKPK